MAVLRRPVLPDVFGRKLGWREWFITNTEWLWFRPLPKTRAELELDASRESEARPKDTIRLNLDDKR